MPFKGYKQTKEHIEKSTSRRLFSDETRKKQSDSSKGKHKSEEHRKNIAKARIGTHRTEETKNKICEKRKLQIMKPVSEVTREKHRQRMINHPNKTFKDTKIELAVEAELIKRGINHIKQVPLCKIAKVDFYLPEYRIVIQVDGCYWHECPIHGKGFSKKVAERDIKQDSVLVFNGFIVYRFWEHEINESVENCIDRLMV